MKAEILSHEQTSHRRGQPFVFDRGQDQQIVDALFADEQAGMRQLVQGGLSRDAVRKRAAQLGMTDGFIKKCRLSGTRPTIRECVNCDAPFLSAGNHNRLCRRCPRR